MKTGICFMQTVFFFLRQKSVSVTPFRGVTYLHIKDVVKRKIVSLSLSEFEKLLEYA